jgi:hypothetical protein
MARRRSSVPSSTRVIEKEMISRGGDGPTSVSVDVEQIANGFISRHTRVEDGEYHTKTEYHPTRPAVEEIIAGDIDARRPPAEANHLKGAVALLNRGKA